ncbi:MAG: hypothetical protein JWO31_993, partial [Phycisphaerales bacterium]|nr:hypothetical protein [Phycisphaerales bacterium]
MPANLSPKIPDRYYTRSEVDAIVAGLPVPDTSGLMPKAGGVFTGPIFVPKGNAGFGSKGINFGAAGDNTGLWMPGDGGVAIGDSGTTRLRVAADGIYPSVPIVGAYQPLKLSTLGGFPVVIGGEAPTGAPTGNATVVANPLWAGAGIVIPGNQSIAMGDGAGTNSSPTFGIVTRAAGWPVNFANANNGYGVRMIGDHGGANAALDVTGPVNIDGPLAATQGATVTGNLTVSGSYLSTGGGITIAGDQNVGGGINVQGSASFVQPIRHGGVADAGSRIQDSFVAGDSSFRHAVTADGAHYWGGGNTNFDTRLRRTAANTLTLDDAAGGPANLALPFEGQLRFGDANH